MHVEVAINKLRYIIEHAKNSRLARVLDKRNLHHRNLLSKLDSVKEEDVDGRVVEICNIVEGISNEDYDVAVAALMEFSRLGYISAQGVFHSPITNSMEVILLKARKRCRHIKRRRSPENHF